MSNTLEMETQLKFIEDKIRSYQEKGLKIFTTSSFQTHSIPLLHILSLIDNTIPVYFLNTGYHFPETINFKEEVASLLDLKVIDLWSPTPKHMQRGSDGKLYFASDPDYCCYLNKVLPLEPVLMKHDVWISGLRKDQNKNRGNFDYEAKGAHDVIRFHPMLDFTRQMIYQYTSKHDLPHHPLESRGYMSVGCEPCTQKIDLERLLDDRQGRWKGMNKTECGLHTELIKH